MNNNFVYANENIILPENKPIINEDQDSKKISNYLIPLEKPTSNIEKAETKKIKKVVVNGEIIPKNKPLFVTADKTLKAKKSKYYSKKDYQIAKISINLMEQRKWSSAEKAAKKAKI